MIPSPTKRQKCYECGEVPHASYEPANAYAGEFYAFGCDCDDPDDYGWGATPFEAELCWVKLREDRQRAALCRAARRQLRFWSVACLLVAVPVAVSLLFKHDTRGDEPRILLVLAVSGVGVVAEMIHWLLSPYVGDNVANLPRPPFRY